MELESWFIPLLTIVGSVAASSGFWAYIQHRNMRNDARTKMLLGLGHDRLLYLCMLFIDRGSITQDEFENLHDYLYDPYVKLGGNGTVTRLMQRVDKLEVVRTIPKN